MVNQVRCPVCFEMIPQNSDRCPHCGRPGPFYTAGQRALRGGLTIAGLAALVLGGMLCSAAGQGLIGGVLLLGAAVWVLVLCFTTEHFL